MVKKRNDEPTLWVIFKVKLKDETIIFHKIKMPHKMYKCLVRSVKISSITSSSDEVMARELFREILLHSLEFEEIVMRYSVK